MMQTVTIDSMDASIVSPPDETLWYAIRTRSRHEKVIIRQLEGAGIEHFLPLATQTHRWSDRKKTVDVPLFPGYAFVRLALRSEHRLIVLRAPGVVSFVGVQGKAQAIPESQIQDIRTVLMNDVPFASHPFLRIGQRVRIRGGALDGVEGILTAQGQDRSLVISVEPIQRSLAIRLDGYHVEPV
jgi:transcription antitermination factor NusG